MASKLPKKNSSQSTNTLKGKAESATIHPTYSWEDNSPTIAKIIHIGVAPQGRARGVGSQLYFHLIQDLRQKNIKRVDACIDKNNLASLQLHQKTGWTMMEKESDYFAYFEISHPG